MDEHIEINQLIRDSRHAGLIIEVHEVPGDIEGFLGIPKPKSDHRKPQRLLFLYEGGQIEPDKVAAFCELVESCMQSQKESPQIMPNDEGMP
jgi:hypothetical protein